MRTRVTDFASEVNLRIKLLGVIAREGQQTVATRMGIRSGRLGEFAFGKRRMTRRVIAALGYDPTVRHYKRAEQTKCPKPKRK